jgi:hypothetical protein
MGETMTKEEKRREYLKQWRERNREKRRAQERERRARDIEKYRAKGRTTGRKHRLLYPDQMREWQQKNQAAGSARMSWQAMRARCLRPTASNYARYGGRGITIDPRWDVFANFLEDMGERPKGKTLDRIDPDGNYCKDNCRWATAAEQRLNQRARC